VLKLLIQFIDRPEMTFAEMMDILSKDFPGKIVLLSGSLARYQYILQVEQEQEGLTPEQGSYLRNSPFCARYIDSYTVLDAHDPITIARDAIRLLQEASTLFRTIPSELIVLDTSGWQQKYIAWMQHIQEIGEG
jgi:hypothetical protein